ncbi:aldehyde dehydrogenase (NADP(+)) [Rhodobacteraceae bacterium DSL-40]|uniref:aldehyde dehydrogenase (NADP(+)) n=1 Tax=Amaricoccus sp. B4 TaxID=3368557 RepID=UPI000DABFD83
MIFTPHGKHLIAGDWVASAETFRSQPAQGTAHDFSSGTVDQVNAACEAAEDAFWTFGYSTRAERATFLDAIAEEIEARADAITAIGSSETGLPEARLQGERGRTVGQLRLFASHIRDGAYLDRRHDAALPDRQPLPRPDLRLMQRPIGPVVVFGASNFPLAFSVAGGDTASAFAAGCPVVVRGHAAHPGTGEIAAEAIHAAVKRCGLHPGTFSFIQGGGNAVGAALVQHPLVKAVGFTGSLGGGRALFDLCAARPEPIPFFGELGSVNPMFLLPEAVKGRGVDIGKGWAGSLAMGAGQFCTNPGIAVILEDQAEAVSEAAREALSGVGTQVMLTDGIAAAYQAGTQRYGEAPGVREILTSTCDRRNAAPFLYLVSGRDWIGNHVLSEEVFGPLGLIVTAADADDMLAIARSFAGQLTATLHMDAGDAELARRLLPILERKAGRVLANAFPTGVEVCDSMVHGGPYPASTNFGATSVGTMAIRRFLRPVCYQGIPEAILPEDLR